MNLLVESWTNNQIIVDITLLLIWFGIALAAFIGKKTTDGTEPWFRRITFAGKLTLFLLICTVSMTAMDKIANKQKSEYENSINEKTIDEKDDELANTIVYRIFENFEVSNSDGIDGAGEFYALVKTSTGLDSEQWKTLIAYRLSLRYLLQRIYDEKFPTEGGYGRSDLGLKDMSEKLFSNSNDKLLDKIKIIRDGTYKVEWGFNPDDMRYTPSYEQVKNIAPEVIRDLNNLINGV